MTDIKLGETVKSLAGHDKDQYFIVINIEHDFVWVCDGRSKLLTAPKKKNIKHIQPIHVDDNPFKETIVTGGRVTNEEIKHFLKSTFTKCSGEEVKNV